MAVVLDVFFYWGDEGWALLFFIIGGGVNAGRVNIPPYTVLGCLLAPLCHISRPPASAGIVLFFVVIISSIGF